MIWLDETPIPFLAIFFRYQHLYFCINVFLCVFLTQKSNKKDKILYCSKLSYELFFHLLISTDAVISTKYYSYRNLLLWQNWEQFKPLFKQFIETERFRDPNHGLWCDRSRPAPLSITGTIYLMSSVSQLNTADVTCAVSPRCPQTRCGTSFN